jgi:hypothetical protein
MSTALCAIHMVVVPPASLIWARYSLGLFCLGWTHSFCFGNDRGRDAHLFKLEMDWVGSAVSLSLRKQTWEAEHF